MKYVTGDIFKLAEEGVFNYVIHGCNCQNAMGSGVAKTVRDNYPQAYAADISTQKGDARKLGHFTHAYIQGIIDTIDMGQHTARVVKSSPFTIINAYTQFGFGTEKVQVDYDAIERVFMGIKLAYDTTYPGVSTFAIPKIGAVRGGGDWDRIEEIIDSVGIINLTCVLYDGDLNK